MNSDPLDDTELETPDDVATILPGDCSEQTGDLLADLLADDTPASPLLFRRWPPRSTYVTLAVAASLTTALFLGVAYFYVDRPEFAFVVGVDPALVLFVILGVVGPLFGLLWPIWRRFLERRRGYRFGDYVFEFGYVVARPAEVTLRTWHGANPTTDADDQRLDTIHTAGGHDIPIGEDFDGDHPRAIHQLQTFESGDLTAEARQLMENDDSAWITSFDQLRHGFFGPLVVASALAATVTATAASVAFQQPLQHRNADRLAGQWNETLDQLRDHEHAAVERFEEFGEMCDDDIQRILSHDHDGEVPDETPLQRVDDEICQPLWDHHPLTYFELDRMYRVVDRDTDDASRDVIKQRLQRYHRSQLRDLRDQFDDDSTDRARLATRLVEFFVDDPQPTIDLHLQPVMPLELVEGRLLLERILRDESLEMPGKEIAGINIVEDHGHQVAQSRLEGLIPMPERHITASDGEGVSSAHRDYVVSPLLEGFENTVQELVGHDRVELDASVADRYLSPHLLEDDEFADIDLEDLLDSNDDEESTSEDDFDIGPLATLDELSDDPPDVDRPTLRVVYGVEIGEDWRNPSAVYPNHDPWYPEADFPVVIQWIEPDDGLVSTIDKTIELDSVLAIDIDAPSRENVAGAVRGDRRHHRIEEPDVEAEREIDHDDPYDYWGQMYASAFEALAQQLEQQVKF